MFDQARYFFKVYMDERSKRAEISVWRHGADVPSVFKSIPVDPAHTLQMRIRMIKKNLAWISGAASVEDVIDEQQAI